MATQQITTRANFFSMFLLLFAAYIATQLMQSMIVTGAGVSTFQGTVGIAEIILLCFSAIGVRKGHRFLGLILGNLLIGSYLVLSFYQLASGGVTNHLLITMVPLLLATYVLNVRIRPHFNKSGISEPDFSPSDDEFGSGDYKKVANY